jgi:hypothetical protein
MLDETRVPDGGAVVTGAAGAVVVGGRDVVGGGALGGRDGAGDAGDVATPVDPCADFVLTEPLGRVVAGLPDADVGELVAPPIDVAVAPPGVLAVGPALDVVVDGACRAAFRAGVEELHAVASAPAQISTNTRTVARWARWNVINAASSVVRPAPIYGQGARFVQILHRSRKSTVPRRRPGAEITSRRGWIVTSTTTQSPTEDDMATARERVDLGCSGRRRGTPARIRSL